MSLSSPPIAPIAGHEGVVVCSVCASANLSVAAYCGSCGTRLLLFCWSCGTAAHAGQRYCQHCGCELLIPETALRSSTVDQASAPLISAGMLPAPAVRPVAAAASLTSLGPSQVAAPMVTSPFASVPASAPVATPPAASPAQTVLAPTPGGSSSQIATAEANWPAAAEILADPSADADDEEPVEERRVVTVLFADIVGFTTLSERLDPEDVRELSATVLGRLAEAITLYGGTIDKFMGDAVMALFGAPIAHEDDPIRAVHAGLAMHQAMASLGETDREGRALELRLRIGINTGEVIAGARNVGGHREYSVFGDVVNTAARLQTAASPGSIYLGEATARSASHVFNLMAIEPLQLKGKQQPVPAYKVRGTVMGAATAVSALGEGTRMPLVGRLNEVRRVRALLNELARGRGELASVIGDHGLGKTRLLAEQRAHAEELGLGWIEAAAPSYAHGLSYRLIRVLLSAVFDFPADANDEQIVGPLKSGLEKFGLRDQLQPLAFVLGVELDDIDPPRLSALQQQRRAVQATREVLRAITTDRPQVVVLDALQWADPSSVDLLLDLMTLTDEAPILFVYVFTPDRDAPSWQVKEHAERSFPHRYTEIALGPLPEAAARDLMCGLLSCADTPAQIEDLVIRRTDGNPYFIEEVLRALIDSGALRKDGERWVANGDITDLHVPDTLLATVMARIDRLPDGVRRTLQVAAVIGREFSERVLRRVLDSGSELERELRSALRAGLIREVAVIPERRYAFAQTLIVEAAAGSLLLRRRREIHVQVGWALEEIYADSLEEQYGDLARHFAEGESWERAFRYSRLAAEQAAASYANDEAVLNFSIALESARRSAAGASPEIVAMLAERRGDVRALIGDYTEALVDYQEALDHHQEEFADADANTPEAHTEAGHIGGLALKAARLYSYRGDITETLALLNLAFNHLPEDSPDYSSAWALKAFVYTWTSNMDAAAEAARKSLKLAQERGGFQHLAEAYEALTHPAMLGVAGKELPELAHEWVRLAREQPEDRPALFKALVAHALTHVWGMYAFNDELRAETEEALELARATGSMAGEHTARGILGVGLFLTGEWQQAEVELRASAGQTTSLAGVGVIFEWWLMKLLTLKGELEPAAERMRSWLEDTSNTHRQIVMNGLLAVNRRLAGDEAGAEAALVAGDAAADRLSCKHCALTLDTIEAELLAETAEPERVQHFIAAAQELGHTYGRDTAVLAADRAEAILDLRANRPDDAARRLEVSLERARQIGQPYEIARTARLVATAYQARRGDGDDVRSKARLQEALAIFERLGAEPDAKQVRTMLEQPLPA